MKTKQISYAYATSPYAKQYGCENDGCFVVEITGDHSAHVIAGGFKTIEEAEAVADTIDYPYNRYIKEVLTMQPTILAQFRNGRRVPITWREYITIAHVFPGAITAIYAG